MQLDHWQYHFDEPLLCRNIFKQFRYKRTLNQLSVYVQFYLRDTTCLNVPSFMVGGNNLESSGAEMFHLLLVTHKFPANDNVCFIIISECIEYHYISQFQFLSFITLLMCCCSFKMR